MKEKYAPLVLQMGLALLFLWFGISQLVDPTLLMGYLPQWASTLPVPPATIILLSSLFETIFGFLLLLGLFTRWAALLLFVHVLIIAFSLGYNDVAIRDFGIAVATFSLFLHGKDQWSMDTKVHSKLKNNILAKLLYPFDAKESAPSESKN